MNGFFQTLQKRVLLSRNLIYALLADPFQTVLRTVLTEFTASLGGERRMEIVFVWGGDWG